MSTTTTTTILFIFFFFFNTRAIAGGQHRRQKPFTAKPTPISIPTNTPSSILQACRATRFPDSCAAALSTATNLPPSPTPLQLTAAAVSISALNLTTAQSQVNSILVSATNNPNRTNAAKNCIEFLSLSSRRLSNASSSLNSESMSTSYSKAGILDAHAFVGAALLYQYDCWSALKYVNTTSQIGSTMQYLIDLTSLTSDALSMIAAYERYGGDSTKWSPPQTERDGYWPELSASSVIKSSFVSVDSAIAAGVSAANVDVCKDGTCKFKTIQAAVDAAPELGTGKYVIFIKEGIYQETVRIPFEKTNVVFVGEGMGKTVITGSLNAGMVGVSTYNTATVGVTGDGFMASNLTFANTAGPDAHQAVAFRSDSDFSIIENVEFLGHQDTLYAHSLRQYYRNCRISGTVDFIFGNSASVFDSSYISILPRQLNPEKGASNTVTAHGRTDPAQPTGFVFRNCIVNGSDDYYFYYRQKPALHKSYLGRPWKEYSRTVFMNSYLAEIIRPEGWLPWDGSFALKTLFYGEYGNTGPGSNTAARVNWSTQIPAGHVGVYSNENFIQGNRWIPYDQ